MLRTKVLVSSCYYIAKNEKGKQALFSALITRLARGRHSHEEQLFSHDVLKAFIVKYPKIPLPQILHRALREERAVCFSSSERDGGTRFKFADEVLFTLSRWDIVPVTCSMSKAIEMLLFCIQENGKKYDWMGVLSFKLQYTVSQNKEKWYCSEVCDTAKRKVGLFPNFYRSHPSESYNIQLFLFNHCEELLGKD